ncbi:DASH family cryptochrome [Leeuwenhoekiella sp. W20_SRS_FM14]|uniref:DASH family cryptochrome n=1 Tax=Leeuwenhoekiella sp. W20_SRS_FM14 TaxID=3240270 RepID=UPI003F9899C2
MAKEKGLLWFKNDLRLLDNETLCRAVNSCTSILPVYIFDPRLFANTVYNFPKAGLNRFEFLKQTVDVLRTNLQNLGANLLVEIGHPEELIPALIKKHKITKLFAEQEYASEELKIVDAVKQQLSEEVTYDFIWGKTLYHIDDIPYSIDKIPLTSKAFRINTTKKAEVRETFDIPKKIEILSLNDWGTLPEATQFNFEVLDDQKENLYVKGGEDLALERLNYYTVETELLTSYKWTRNKSLGLDYSSKLSPYLAVGAISPRTIYYAVKAYEKNIKKNISTWWLVFEVVWRDFFTFKGMRMGNSIFKTEGYKNKEVPFENNTEYFERWCAGTTGIPFIDAHMRQLNETGYMSNRGRVNCASYFVHDLKIDWTWGAAYFESKLIDYDVSSNWMNWHMQAYEIWYTNPVNQSIKYKAADYIKKWIPELAAVNDELIHIPWKIEEYKLKYPKPIEVYSKWERAEIKILKLLG